LATRIAVRAATSASARNFSAQTGANTAMTAFSELAAANFSAVVRLMKPKPFESSSIPTRRDRRSVDPRAGDGQCTDSAELSRAHITSRRSASEEVLDKELKHCPAIRDLQIAADSSNQREEAGDQSQNRQVARPGGTGAASIWASSLAASQFGLRPGLRPPKTTMAQYQVRTGIKERCVEPPQPSAATVVGNYRMLGQS
jgi:hypothetical protein